MSSNLKKIEYSGWAGGLNAMADRTSVQKDQLVTADNVVILPEGVISRRPGMLDAGFGDDTIKIYSLWDGRVSGTSVVTYHASDKKIKKANAAAAPTVLHTYANDAKGQFEFFNSVLLHTNGSDIMQQWDLAAGATSDVVGSPLSRMVLKHNDRIFAAAGSVLYETTVNTAIDFAGGAAWNIGLGDGENISGLGSLGTDLFIFKKTKVYRMSGYTKAERQTMIFSPDVGSVYPDTIKTANLSGVGEVVIFLSSSLKICYLNIAGWARIGEYVQTRLDTIGANSNSAHAIVYKAMKIYILAFQGLTGEETECLCLHLDSPYRSKLGTRWGFTRWIPGTMPANYDSTFEAFFESPSRGLLVATRNVLGVFTYYTIAYFLVGSAREDMITGGYLPVPSVIRTRDEDNDNPTSNKQWRWVLVRESGSAGLISAFTEYTDETVSAKTSTETMNAALTTRTVDFWIELVNSARSVSLQLDFRGSDPTYSIFEIAGMTIFYKPSQVENRK